MALTKQAVPINFSQGLDTKSDPKQVQLGKFLALNNSVFDKQGGLVKRNGFGNITDLPNTEQTTLTTLNDNLLATGSNLYAFSQNTNQWLNQGVIQPVQLETQSLVRSSTSQTSADASVTSTGLTCLVYMDSGIAYYQVSDSNTGQQIVNRTALPATAKNPRVVLLGQYFIITFIATVSGSPHLQFIAVPTAVPSSPLAADDLSATVNTINAAYDVYVSGQTLYAGWSSTPTTVRMVAMNSILIVSAPVTITATPISKISVTAEIVGTNNVVWATYWDAATNNAHTTSYNNVSNFLINTLAPTQILTGVVVSQITSVSSNGLLTVFYETDNTYSFAPNAKTDYVSVLTVTSPGGVVSSPTVILRSVGLASKPFIKADGVIYTLVAYGETNQPTYFLIDSTGNIYMRLAYSNGGGYLTTQVLPSVSQVDDTYLIPYLIKDLLTTVNKTTDPTTPTSAVYTQTGINLAKFSINTVGQLSAQIASTLHLTGGQLWMYDGVRPVEHGFHVWPENAAVTTSTTGGSLSAQQYNYVFTYEWTDNQGNLHRSAPSIPLAVTTTGATSTNTINVPTLRLTYKLDPNPVRIVGYRWSVAQQTYYQFTSVTSPVINDTTVDSVTIVDTLADSSIIGNAILYTTGGVIENIAAPASIASALFKNRLFLVDAEDQNLLWFSKQVIEAVPVEMSDLLTIYIAPTSGAQGSTGPITALSALDDKLIIFKNTAIYYLTGIGPDNTGASNDFTDPVYITASVGCANPNSIVLMPQGIMFQSDKGIWLLGRDLNTTYVGAPVEQYNDIEVVAAKAIPGTNQVRFVLSNSITLVYDYYYGQWGTHSNVNAISATLYQGKDTYLNSYGSVYQETPSAYLDGSRAVLMSFTTSWINIAGVQGYERFYEMYLLGTYFTPFKLSMQIAYDYNTSSLQTTTITPDNYTGKWGSENQWGSGGPWGGPGNVFEARLFPQVQKCESFQVTLTEIYDPQYGGIPGEGLSLSGLNLVIGAKKGYRTQKASQSFG